MKRKTRDTFLSTLCSHFDSAIPACLTCTGDDVIGCAYLGMLAHDKSEIEQWKSTVEHMGKEYKGTHNLKPPHSAPPVHVAETGDNDEDDD
ncbi:hypothetical protein COOONC_12548 [Cooperia oncophora]